MRVMGIDTGTGERLRDFRMVVEPALPGETEMMRGEVDGFFAAICAA